MAFALAWVALSLWLAMPWIDDLDRLLGPVPGWMAVIGIALLPGYLNAHLLASIVLARFPPLPDPAEVDFPPLTVLIAAFNEEKDIARCIELILEQDYPGELEVVVIDDGSSDATAEIVRTIAAAGSSVRLLQPGHGGKTAALNHGLETAVSPLVATVDADTQLAEGSLRRLVTRLLVSDPDTLAVAGAVFVSNPEDSLLAREQDWDYFLGIATIKREQAMLLGTLVAQGAFSVYDRAALQAVGGWPDAIGEDIVLTWRLLEMGGKVGYESTALAFTEVPTGLGAFFRQRRRWARGMIEGLRVSGWKLLKKHKLYSHSVFVDCLLPYIDFSYCVFFLPGVVLAFTGNFAIVGPMTLAVLPLNLLMAAAMMSRQRRAFRAAGLEPPPAKHNLSGLLTYLGFYQVIGSPISVSCYVLELVRAPRRW
jgi:poly-beta-1,6-N-acetyl-D-glucosamine synthase